MSNFALNATRMSLGMLERLLKSRIHTYGTEHIRDRPTLYVVNHFTRFETFIVPYVLNKTTGREVRSLAHSSLFKGAVGDYLRRLGAVSTGHPARNRLIIGDLMTGTHDWVIYPEGIMMKNKQISPKGRGYEITTPKGKTRPRTGAAMLALKAQYSRKEFFDCWEKGEHERAVEIGNRYGFQLPDDLSRKDLSVTPVTITYYPIRPGRNLIKRVVMKLIRDLPERVQEELEVEGNLLLGETDIAITFGRPLEVSEYLGHIPASKRVMKIIVGEERMEDVEVWMRKGRLTRDFMREIYSNLRVNLDHLMCNGFRQLKTDDVSERDYKKAVYLAARRVGTDGDFHFHRSLTDELIHLVADERCDAAEDLLELAEEEEIIRRENGRLLIDREALRDDHDFHDVRLKNTVRILANEVGPLPEVTKIVSGFMNLSPEELDHRLVQTLIERDLALYEDEYETYFDEERCIDREVGCPRLLEGSKDAPGVLLSHGYLSSPREVAGLARFLNDQGYWVYIVRMQGHGTSPRNLEHIRWQQWYVSYLRGYAILRHSCKKVVLGGFSTGGLLALVKGSHRGEDIIGGFSINSPLRLVNIKTRFVPAVARWNDLLEYFHLGGSDRDVLSHTPENAETNYTLNSVNGMYQLGLLMDTCSGCLKDVEAPWLLIQADEDPAVVPDSAGQIQKKMTAERVELEMMPFDRHGILSGEGHEAVYQRVSTFLESLRDDR